MSGPKKKKKLKKKNKDNDDVAIAAMLGTIPGSIDYFPDNKELWIMGDKTYETTEEERKKMETTPEQAMMGGGKVMRYFHGGGVESPNKHQGQYDIQVKKIKGKGKVQ